MRIVNGKWQDENGNPIDDFNVSRFLKIRDRVKVMYGSNITHNKINIISSISELTDEEESSLSYLLERNDVSLSKLAGY